MKKVPESQVSALKAHNSQKNLDTIERVNKAIDTLKKKNATINFETVAKAAGVSRATLYNNPKLKERIMGLRAIAFAPAPDADVDPKKTKVQRLEETVADLKARVRQLETDKKNLVVQLIDYEEIKEENVRLRRQIMRGVLDEERKSY